MLAFEKKRPTAFLFSVIAVFTIVPLLMGFAYASTLDPAQGGPVATLSAETTPAADPETGGEGPVTGGAEDAEPGTSADAETGTNDTDTSSDPSAPDSATTTDTDNGTLTVEELFLTPAAAGIVALAASTSSDLADFLTAAHMYHINDDGTTTEVQPGDTVLIGQNYLFRLSFAETPLLQMAYNGSGYLTYQLPADLTIQQAIPQTALRGDNNAVIGWYTIDTSGLVEVWFDNVQMNGQPTPDGSNLIDYYANVEITLNITAQLTGGSGGDIDFGNDVVVEFPPPVAPDPSLAVNKSSSYRSPDPLGDSVSGRLYYMITVTALGGPIHNLNVFDAPALQVAGGSQSFDNTVNAFSAFSYTINGGSTMIPMSGVVPSDSPLNWSYNSFTEADMLTPLTLQEGEFITIRYSINVEQLILNNNGSGQLLEGMSPYIFDIIVNNTVMAMGQDEGNNAVDPGYGHTSDPIQKVLTFEKDGVRQGNQIFWSIVIGDGTVQLNEGILTDTHVTTPSGAGTMTFPPASEIMIELYGPGDTLIPGSPFPLDFFTYAMLPNDGGFTWTVPATTDLTGPGPSAPFGPILRAELTYTTTITVPDTPGEAPVSYNNDVRFELPDGTIGEDGANVIVKADNVQMTKTTSGICGRPDGANGTGPQGQLYYVDYTIRVTIPAGLQGEPLYLYDNLGMYGSGESVRNVPENLVVQAFIGGSAAPTAIPHTDAIQYYANSWRMAFGATGSTFPTGEAWGWPYNVETDLVVSYRIWLSDTVTAGTSITSPPNTITKLMQGQNLRNNSYMINSRTEGPDLGSPGNVVGTAYQRDWWPITKTTSKTGNPTLFNYTVTIRGDYSDRTSPFLTAGNSPIFTDNFDANMIYVPGSLYVSDPSNSGRFFMPAGDVDNSGPGYFNVDLSGTWNAFSGTTPSVPLNPPVGTAPANWFAVNQNLVFHYQLQLVENTDVPHPELDNTAAIEVNPGECMFEASATQDYDPQPIGKTMTPTGNTSIMDVAVTINADGSIEFSDGTNPAPDQITAKDLMTNVMMFTDTVTFYTQTYVNGRWDGNWVAVPGPYSFNTGSQWSINVVDPPETSIVPDATSQVDFVVPNGTPVRVTYQVRVTLPVGETGRIANTVSIFGETGDTEDDTYVVGEGGIGVGAGRQALRVFKTDNLGNNLAGAGFRLYATVLDANNVPPGGLPVARSVLGSDGTLYRFGLLQPEGQAGSEVFTDASGTGLFANQWINTSYQMLYMLVETTPPQGYVPAGDDWVTYFTLCPSITDLTVSQLATNLRDDVDRVSDFVSVINVEDHLGPGDLRIRKVIEGLTDAQIAQHLHDEFQIRVWGFLPPDEASPETRRTFTLEQATSPGGIIFRGLQPGIYFIDEINFEVPGFDVSIEPTTLPDAPIRHAVFAGDTGGVEIRITNTYTAVPIVPGPEPPVTPDRPGDDVAPVTPGRIPPDTTPSTGDMLQAVNLLVMFLAALTAIMSATALIKMRETQKKEAVSTTPEAS